MAKRKALEWWMKDKTQGNIKTALQTMLQSLETFEEELETLDLTARDFLEFCAYLSKALEQQQRNVAKFSKALKIKLAAERKQLAASKKAPSRKPLQKTRSRNANKR
jgi:hypothetical protein